MYSELRYVFDMNDVWHVFVCQGNMWAGLGTIICLVGGNKNMNIAEAKAKTQGTCVKLNLIHLAEF